MEPLSPETEKALQKRDLDDLRDAVTVGFEGVHKRQDETNGKVLKNTTDINALQVWNEKRIIENKYNKLIWYIVTVETSVIVAFVSYLLFHNH